MILAAAAAWGQDGSIAAWGHNVFGEKDVPPPNAWFVAVAAGYGHSLGVKALACYPDCDGTGALDLFDFLYFTNSFSSGR